jgi:hypothetical protein
VSGHVAVYAGVAGYKFIDVNGAGKCCRSLSSYGNQPLFRMQYPQFFGEPLFYQMMFNSRGNMFLD